MTQFSDHRLADILLEEINKRNDTFNQQQLIYENYIYYSKDYRTAGFDPFALYRVPKSEVKFKSLIKHHKGQIRNI